MKNIITISRETGSGGHTIGQMLAEKLGYAFYDGAIVEQIGKELQIKNQAELEAGEYMNEDTEYALLSGYIPYRPFARKDKVPFEKINERQRAFIKRLADEGNCVIVGRNADEILKEYPNAFHVFIHADMEHRVKRVLRHERNEKDTKEVIFSGATPVAVNTEKETATQGRIRRELELKDKTRAAHYNYFTGRTWGMVSNYNLAIDTSVMTKTAACELIIEAIKKTEGGVNNA